jgi:hypothetical protein
MYTKNRFFVFDLFLMKNVVKNVVQTNHPGDDMVLSFLCREFPSTKNRSNDFFKMKKIFEKFLKNFLQKIERN